METPDTVHRFWFGDDPDQAATIARQTTLWWAKNPDIDVLMRARFEPLLLQAELGQLDGWQQHALGTLALVLLADQFPRNIYRDTPRAFSFDGRARSLCKEALVQGYDRSLRPIERVFLYMPLQHSEDRIDQALSVRLFCSLAAVLPADLAPSFQGFVDYARRHRDIIERFGRFPHRNAILGRQSTSAELAFLKEPGSSF